jgi:hypothetical protein
VIGSVRDALQASLAAADGTSDGCCLRRAWRRTRRSASVTSPHLTAATRMMAAMEDDARSVQVGSCWATAGNGRRVLAGADRLVLNPLAARGPEVLRSYVRPPAPSDADPAFDAYMEMVREHCGGSIPGLCRPPAPTSGRRGRKDG